MQTSNSTYVFKPGDRVRVVSDPDSPEAIGRVGTVVDYFFFVGVVLDAPVWSSEMWWGTKNKPAPYLSKELELL